MQKSFGVEWVCCLERSGGLSKWVINGGKQDQCVAYKGYTYTY